MPSCTGAARGDDMAEVCEGGYLLQDFSNTIDVTSICWRPNPHLLGFGRVNLETSPTSPWQLVLAAPRTSVARGRSSDSANLTPSSKTISSTKSKSSNLYSRVNWIPLLLQKLVEIPSLVPQGREETDISYINNLA